MDSFHLSISTLALIAIITASIAPINAYSSEAGWEILENEYFIIYYRPGYGADANKTLEWAMLGRNATLKVIPHSLDTKVKIYLWDAEGWRRPPWQAYADTARYEIHLLAPSDQDKFRGTQWYCGDYCKDPLWYIYAVTHEYVHIVINHIAREPGKPYAEVPAWLHEGFASYIPDYHTVPGMVEKHWWYYEPAIRAIRSGDGYILVLSGITYGGQALIARYIYEVYGSDSIVCLLRSLWKAGFAGSLKLCMNTSVAALEDRWFDWLSKTFNISRDLYPRYTIESLGRAYSELVEAYKSLSRSCGELNNSIRETLDFLRSISADTKTLRGSVEDVRAILITMSSDLVGIGRGLNSTALALITLTSNTGAILEILSKVNATLMGISGGIALIEADVSALASALRSVNLSLSRLIEEEGGRVRAAIVDSSGKVVGSLEILGSHLNASTANIASMLMEAASLLQDTARREDVIALRGLAELAGAAALAALAAAVVAAAASIYSIRLIRRA